MLIRAKVNGNIVDETPDQAKFLVGTGLFEYLESTDGEGNPPAVVGAADVAEPPPAPTRRSRRRTV